MRADGRNSQRGGGGGRICESFSWHEPKFLKFFLFIMTENHLEKFSIFFFKSFIDLKIGIQVENEILSNFS